MLFEDCPHKVGALPTPLFNSLLASLKYGANQYPFLYTLLAIFP
jgi:hypothetical protein